MRLGTEAALKVALQGLGLSGRVNTAFLELVNLTTRHGIAALARRNWATTKPAPHLLAHLEWWRAYSHFVRSHASLRVVLVQPRERGGKLLAQCYRQRTPAMAAERTNRRWTVQDPTAIPTPLHLCLSKRPVKCCGIGIALSCRSPQAQGSAASGSISVCVDHFHRKTTV
jgi:hypothetical protein